MVRTGHISVFSIFSLLTLASGLIVHNPTPLVAQEAPAASKPAKSEKATPKVRLPKGAKVLFDGKDLAAWGKRGTPDQTPVWPIADGEVTVQPGAGDMVTREKFGDYQLHVEFQIPYLPDKHSQERGNSGVYQQGQFEIQVLDAYKNDTYAKGGCAAIYGFKDPDQNVAKPPLEWQTYDITYRAPRFDTGMPAKMIEHPRLTLLWNGVKVHDNVEITCGPTASSLGGEITPNGPIMLQDHGCQVKYRNVWIKPLSQKEIDKALPTSTPASPDKKTDKK